jgi:ABC-2 type transport system permease protein
VTALPAPFRPNDPVRLARLSWARTAVEVKSFYRSPMQLFFTFLLPVLFVVIFSTIFSRDIDGPPGTEPVPFALYFIPGMIAAGVMSTTFASLALTISIEQHEGQVRRLAATPLPPGVYFAGKLGLAAITSAAEVVLILAIGVAFYGISLPTELSHWLAFAAIFVVGVSTCSLLGIAYTRVIGSANAAPAVIQPPYLILQFISGVFIRYSEIPGWLQAVASVFPLKWMTQGFRYVFLPDWVAGSDYGGGWHIDYALGVLAIWFVLSFIAARRFFKWSRSGVG